MAFETSLKFPVPSCSNKLILMLICSTSQYIIRDREGLIIAVPFTRVS